MQTKGPIKILDYHVAGVGGVHDVNYSGVRDNGDTSRLLESAFNSYDKHCGPRAVECAEEDLLGEALEALGRVCAYLTIHDPNYWETNTGAKKARAVLAKAEATK